MRIDKKYILWELAKPAASAAVRPALEHIFVARIWHDDQPYKPDEDYPDWLELPMKPPYSDVENAIAIATDSFALAVVPIELYDEDIPGTFPGELLEIANKKASVGGNVFMELKDNEVLIPFLGQTNPRQRNDITYPDFRDILNDMRERFRDDDNKCELMLDNIRLNRLCKALGIKTTGNPGNESGISIYSLSKDYGMLLITKNHNEKGKPIVPPFGLLMEMHRR